MGRNVGSSNFFRVGARGSRYVRTMPVDEGLPRRGHSLPAGRAPANTQVAGTAPQSTAPKPQPPRRPRVRCSTSSMSEQNRGSVMSRGPPRPAAAGSGVGAPTSGAAGTSVGGSSPDSSSPSPAASPSADCSSRAAYSTSARTSGSIVSMNASSCTPRGGCEQRAPQAGRAVGPGSCSGGGGGAPTGTAASGKPHARSPPPPRPTPPFSLGLFQPPMTVPAPPLVSPCRPPSQKPSGSTWTTAPRSSTASSAPSPAR